MSRQDPFGVERELETAAGTVRYHSLTALADAGVGHVAKLPVSIKVLLESLLRNVDGFVVTEQNVRALAEWNASNPAPEEIPFKPARVVLQDFTGVPAVVDLAALRDACKSLGGDPAKINPLVPCDLVIDHSVQVDHFGSADALDLNLRIEFQRNRERYEFLKWGQQAFDNFKVVPPGTGIVHQVNLEYLASVVMTQDGVAYPDSLVGTDSHTTMINGLGVAGWGVGGIEAEAVMLGQPIYMLTPRVVGFKLIGELPEGATATDMVLTVTEVLREKGVVGQFVEFFGPGAAALSLPDRATIANMAPEYGATMGFFPVDEVTCDYLRITGRTEEQIDLVEKYCRAQGLWRSDDPLEFTRTFELDLSTIEPSLAGPKRPQDRIALSAMKSTWETALVDTFGKTLPGSGESEMEAEGAVAVAEPGTAGVEVTYNDQTFTLQHGAVVIAAITSCTNTSNPDVLVAAGLVAQKALAKGMTIKPWVKTSLAPGSRVVTDYLEAAGLNEPLDAIGFQTVGYGCTTCIGNSGPLPEPISQGITEGDLVACSVLSGNRNFEGRVNPHVKANYLASPPLVVAYALAGSTDIDITTEPVGADGDGNAVYLKDIWPTTKEVRDAVSAAVKPEQFLHRYSDVATGPEAWQAVESPTGEMYSWPEASTYIQHPPFFQGMSQDTSPIEPITGARALALLGDSVTTDHISPAGAIPDGPAADYLSGCGVEPRDFNSFGSRRGNDRVMTRGTFANIRVRNQLAPGTEGGYTTHLPSGEQMYVHEAAEKYRDSNTPLVVLTGKDYGMGSSRDWAAKGTYLLGVRAVIAESYERIHRSNLVGMGVLPLEFKAGDTRESLGLSGHEIFDIAVDDTLQERQDIQVTATDPESGDSKKFSTLCRVDTPVEVEYYRNGGILHTVLRKLTMSDDDQATSQEPTEPTTDAPVETESTPAPEPEAPAPASTGLDTIRINAKVKIFNFKKGDVAELDQYLEDPNCSEDTALLAYWSLEGPWYYNDEEAATNANGDLLIKLRDRIIGGHYKKEPRLSFNPISAMRISLLQTVKLEKAGIDAKIMRQ
jgi:aconitate hydratase